MPGLPSHTSKSRLKMGGSFLSRPLFFSLFLNECVVDSATLDAAWWLCFLPQGPDDPESTHLAHGLSRLPDDSAAPEILRAGAGARNQALAAAGCWASGNGDGGWPAVWAWPSRLLGSIGVTCLSCCPAHLPAPFSTELRLFCPSSPSGLFRWWGWAPMA